MLLRLLGPFSAVAGQPITLCWRLERSTAGPAGAAVASIAGAASGAGPVAAEEEAATPLIYDIMAEVRQLALPFPSINVSVAAVHFHAEPTR